MRIGVVFFAVLILAAPLAVRADHNFARFPNTVRDPLPLTVRVYDRTATIWDVAVDAALAAWEAALPGAVDFVVVDDAAGTCPAASPNYHRFCLYSINSAAQGHGQAYPLQITEEADNGTLRELWGLNGGTLFVNEYHYTTTPADSPLRRELVIHELGHLLGFSDTYMTTGAPWFHACREEYRAPPYSVFCAYAPGQFRVIPEGSLEQAEASVLYAGTADSLHDAYGQPPNRSTGVAWAGCVATPLDAGGVGNGQIAGEVSWSCADARPGRWLEVYTAEYRPGDNYRDGRVITGSRVAIDLSAAGAGVVQTVPIFCPTIDGERRVATWFVLATNEGDGFGRGGKTTIGRNCPTEP